MSTHDKAVSDDSEDVLSREVDDSMSRLPYDPISVESTSRAFVATHTSLLQDIATLRDISAAKRSKLVEKATAMMEAFSYISRAATAKTDDTKKELLETLHPVRLGLCVDKLLKVSKSGVRLDSRKNDLSNIPDALLLKAGLVAKKLTKLKRDLREIRSPYSLGAVT